MTQAQIIQLQKDIGATPDGFWGPKSIAACQKHLRALMPKKNPWPKPDQKSLTAFYGPTNSEAQLVNLSVVGLGLRYEGKPVKTVRCHAKVADSLHRVLTELSVTCPEILALYDGCFNPRPMRNGSLPSLHARGAAVDFNQAKNRLNWHWPTVAIMPLKVMEAFAREGWKCAGAFWHRDAMHFEATS